MSVVGVEWVRGNREYQGRFMNGRLCNNSCLSWLMDACDGCKYEICILKIETLQESAC